MRVSRVAMKNFMRHDDMSVDFPENGLVVFLGPNGSGKSAVIEAVATSCWNKSLRNETPWRKDQGGSVSVVVNGDVNAERKADKRVAKTFHWKVVGEDKKIYDTPTKAQQALVAEIGTFDQWCRTHVFSSQDVSHFSMATDGERKALIEELLGLSVFDTALELCSEDLKQAKDESALLERDKDRAKMKFESAKEAYNLVAMMGPPRPEEPVVTALRSCTPPTLQLEAAEQGLKERRAKSFQVSTMLTNGVAVANAQLMLARSKVEKLKSGVCPTCEQDVAFSTVGEFEREVGVAYQAASQASESLEVAQKENAVAATANQDAIVLLEEQLREAQAFISEQNAQDRVLDRYKQELVAWEKRQDEDADKRTKAVKRWEEAEEALGELEDKSAGLQVDVDYLKMEREILGVRGARVGVLASALEGIEAVANVWMVKFFDSKASLRLNPTSELKSGKTVATIGLEVYGVGGEVGYKGLSGGERRRVDVALIMALAEVQAAAAGKDRGTLFMDEVFDSLDAQGREAVQHEMRELAKERTVVVITHVDELASRLNADLLVRFAGKQA